MNSQKPQKKLDQSQKIKSENTSSQTSNSTTAEKRELLRIKLKNDIPTKMVIFFGIVFILIGLVSIGLEIALIHYRALNYKLANGIWGGYFSILNGLIKINLGNYDF